jgi:glycine/sarcosine N-methyltransferase
MHASAPSPVVDFYDALAAEYHLVYGDRWDDAVAGQGAALDRLIRDARPHAHDILDCSCGIGTQAIGVALHGYRVEGTDISARSIDRARVEAARLGADVVLGVADFRHLDSIRTEFDVVMSCDNSIPHLLSDEEIAQALRTMRAKLRPGGLLVITVRDYDKALVERPVIAPPLLLAGPPRRLFVRMHDWDGPDSPLYTVRLFIITETAVAWTLTQHATRYRAFKSEELTRVARDAGFVDSVWRPGDSVGFHQPVMTATNPGG